MSKLKLRKEAVAVVAEEERHAVLETSHLLLVVVLEADRVLVQASSSCAKTHSSTNFVR